MTTDKNETRKGGRKKQLNDDENRIVVKYILYCSTQDYASTTRPYQTKYDYTWPYQTIGDYTRPYHTIGDHRVYKKLYGNYSNPESLVEQMCE